MNKLEPNSDVTMACTTMVCVVRSGLERSRPRGQLWSVLCSCCCSLVRRSALPEMWLSSMTGEQLVHLEYWCQQLTFDYYDTFRIKLRVPHQVAGGIAALRAGLEALVVEVAKDPEYIRKMDQKKQRMLNIIRHISKPATAGITLVTNNSR